MPVDSQHYYSTYSGHNVKLLEEVHRQLRKNHKSLVFLAGDSSLDNKFWFNDTVSALNGYEQILQPPRMKTDVCYWLNKEAVRRGATDVACINTAVEASSLNSRSFCTLLEQDAFIRDHITSEDVLVVSVGGNDIALMPVLLTVLNLLLLSWCTPVKCLDNCACAYPVNTHCDGGCLTCGVPGCLSGFLCGWPPGVGYFADLFKNRVGNYIRRMVSKTKPKKVVVCMIYFLDETQTGSWADGALGCMCYNCFPYRLQSAIRAMYRVATKKIKIDGTEVVAFPLFKVLDGKTSSDYLERVEPSPSGGEKMACGLMDAILQGPGASDSSSSSAPSQCYME